MGLQIVTECVFSRDLLAGFDSARYSNQKGQVWVAENEILKAMSVQNLNFDKMFKIPLQDRTDQRDLRPLNLPGRLVRVLGSESVKGCVWEGCSLWDKERTEMSIQIGTADMITFDEIDPNALPTATTGSIEAHHATVRGAQRYEKLHPDASTKLLDSMFDAFGSSGSTISVALVVDLSVGSGCIFESFLVKKLGISMPTYFFGVCPDEKTKGWMAERVMQGLRETYHLLCKHSCIHVFLHVVSSAHPRRHPQPKLAAGNHGAP